MGIEQTYNILSERQRSRQKKEERNKLLGLGLTAVADHYERNLNRDRENFFKDSDIIDRRLKKKKALDIFNTIKADRDKGMKSLGGYGEYLVVNEAIPKATQAINSLINEGDLTDQKDNYEKAIRSYAEDIVYGQNRDGKGLLAAREKAYNEGSKLMSMEDYDTFLLETAKLPKSVGNYMLARIFDDKSRSEIFNDALQRVKTNTGLPKDSVAEQAFNEAVDKGLDMTAASSLANQVKSYLTDITFRKGRTLERVEDASMSIKTMDGGIKTLNYKVPYYSVRDDFGNITTRESKGTLQEILDANKNDKVASEALQDKLTTIRLETNKIIHPNTGKEHEETTAVIRDQDGNIVGQTTKDSALSASSVDTFKSVDSDVLENIRGTTAQVVGNGTPTEDSAFRKRETKYIANLAGVSAKGQDNQKRQDFYENNILLSINGYGAKIQVMLGRDNPESVNLGRKIAAQAYKDDVNYHYETEDTNYPGKDIVAGKPVINSLRVLQAMQNLADSGDDEVKEILLSYDPESLMEDFVSDASIQDFIGLVGDTRNGKQKARNFFITEEVASPMGSDSIYNLPINQQKTTLGAYIIAKAAGDDAVAKYIK